MLEDRGTHREVLLPPEEQPLQAGVHVRAGRSAIYDHRRALKATEGLLNASLATSSSSLGYIRACTRALSPAGVLVSVCLHTLGGKWRNERGRKRDGGPR